MECMSLYIKEAVLSSDANSFEESNVFESSANADFLIADKCSWETEKSAVPSRVTLKKRSAVVLPDVKGKISLI